MSILICKSCNNKVKIHGYCLQCWYKFARIDVINALSSKRAKVGYKNNTLIGFFIKCLINN